MLDNVLARPRVTRCRACYKPCDGEGAKRRRIHDSCQQHTFECNNTKCGFKGDYPPPELMSVPAGARIPAGASEEHKADIHRLNKRKANIESLNLATMMWIPRKCQRCGSHGRGDVCPRPECRPKSTKVAR